MSVSRSSADISTFVLAVFFYSPPCLARGKNRLQYVGEISLFHFISGVSNQKCVTKNMLEEDVSRKINKFRSEECLHGDTLSTHMVVVTHVQIMILIRSLKAMYTFHR
jgi:hypothetical protein